MADQPTRPGIAADPRYTEHYALYDRRTVLPTDYTTHGGHRRASAGCG